MCEDIYYTDFLTLFWFAMLVNDYTDFLTLFWLAMLVNEYRLEIQFKKVQKVRNINNIPMVGSRPIGM
jgi:hypothetical protein